MAKITKNTLPEFPVTVAGTWTPEDRIQHETPIGPRNDIGTRVQSHIERYIAFNNPHHAPVLALWTLHTWVFDAFNLTPYIYVSSIDPGAGKTTLMEVMEGIVNSPELTANTSAAAMFRKLQEKTPTIILDEVDTIYSGAKNDELRNVLNSGYKSNGTVERFTGKETEVFPTFCPKFLGGIDNGQVPATVMDRSLRIRLRKLSGDALAAMGIEEYDYEELLEDESYERLQQDVSAWGTVQMAETVKAQQVERVEGLSARQWQLIRPLLKIAKVLGWEDAARVSLTAIFMGESDETLEVAMLRKLRNLFDTSSATRLPTAAMAEVTGYTVERMGRILGRMGVKSHLFKLEGVATRGYSRVELEDAFSRFLD